MYMCTLREPADSLGLVMFLEKEVKTRSMTVHQLWSGMFSFKEIPLFTF